MSQQGGSDVGHGLWVIAGLLRCYCFSLGCLKWIKIWLKKKKKTLQNNYFVARIKYRTLYLNVNVWPVVKWWHEKTYLQTLFITFCPLSLSTLFFMSVFLFRTVSVSCCTTLPLKDCSTLKFSSCSTQEASRTDWIHFQQPSDVPLNLICLWILFLITLELIFK